jgi:hypothetical protein
MSQSCIHRTTCRLCRSRNLELVLSLTPTPPANAFITAADLNENEERFPLDVFFCRDCGHVQLLDVVDPSILFKNYVYVSGTSPVFVNHFKNYAAEMIQKFKLGKEAFVVEIGSNDGTLLRFFKEAGMGVLGIDPAQAIARSATMFSRTPTTCTISSRAFARCSSCQAFSCSRSPTSWTFTRRRCSTRFTMSTFAIIR